MDVIVTSMLWLWVEIQTSCWAFFHSIHPDLVSSSLTPPLLSSEKNRKLTQQPGNPAEGSYLPLPLNLRTACTGPPLSVSPETTTSVYLCESCCLPFSPPPSSDGLILTILGPQPPPTPFCLKRPRHLFTEHLSLSYCLLFSTSSHCLEGKDTSQPPLPSSRPFNTRLTLTSIQPTFMHLKGLHCGSWSLTTWLHSEAWQIAKNNIPYL